MIRVTVIAAAAAVFAFPAFAQRDEPGKILCQQDVQQARQHLQANKSQWSGDKYADAIKRLDLAEEQCGHDSGVASEQLSMLREEMGMPRNPQAAQTPKR